MATISPPRSNTPPPTANRWPKPISIADSWSALLEALDQYFEADPDVYVSGNLILCYNEEDGRIHVAPDVFVTFGIPKLPMRDNYLLWKEGKPPDIVIELTSKSTNEEDVTEKFAIYRDIIKVPEYFLFDPYEEYLRPSLRGYRLVNGEYVAIEPVDGRLPSESLGLHLERDGTELRLFDPATGRRLLTPLEQGRVNAAARQAAEAARQAAEAARQPPRPTVKPPKRPAKPPKPPVEPPRPRPRRRRAFGKALRPRPSPPKRTVKPPRPRLSPRKRTPRGSARSWRP